MEKQKIRLTITLLKENYDKIKKTVYEKDFKNNSEAVNYIIKKYIGNEDDKAINKNCKLIIK